MGSYCSASDVATWAPMLVRGTTIFSTSTSPTLEQVEGMIQWVYSDMQTHFHSQGYSGSAPSTAGMFDSLVMLNSLGAAALAELTRIVDTVRNQERTRGQVLWKMYENMRNSLMMMDLSQAGFAVDNVAPYAGGVDIDDKAIDEGNTSLVPPRFFRSQFRIPGTTIRSPNSEEDW